MWWDRLMSLIGLALSHWKLILVLIGFTGLGHFAEDGINYAKERFDKSTIQEAASDTKAEIEQPTPAIQETTKETIYITKSCPICPEIDYSRICDLGDHVNELH